MLPSVEGGGHNLIRGFVIQRLMRPLRVVKVVLALEPLSQFSAVIKSMQIEVLILDGPP